MRVEMHCGSKQAKDSLEELWMRAKSPPGDLVRGDLPSHCNREWFLGRFCDTIKEDALGEEDSIWEHVNSFPLHDAVALLAAVPELCKYFFTPKAKKARSCFPCACHFS